ncbi:MULTISPECIES: helix-turn-helix domain-containing protein [Bradyrhizobium]|uniref:helix-turn-helix domain-containing protein n=1 Tax=Bradyrhizobium TaxID=374 RepID=UPI0004ACC19E|nr:MULTISPECIES: helix-turn-helix domain-containing protein [unclassified Bradyrhizobium]
MVAPRSILLNTDEIPLTHSVLAQLLGVRRASVTDCLDLLESEGLIRTKRGQISICRFGELANMCCDCFRLIDREYDRQLASVRQIDHVEDDALFETSALDPSLGSVQTR